ncbi:ribonuclease HII [Oxyplasma meridianum]|uniref:Ribonuclease HII n=1 Tax=Oxyplasma meridianum TaxID=3073602 RepID=A0AAX4NEC5_9ARCH
MIVSNNRRECQCGIDEAGRGPVIGPMVMAMVCGDPAELKKAGVRDSKELTPARREMLFDRMDRLNLHKSLVVISPGEINDMMERITLNEIERHFALQLLRDAECDVYVDSFDVNPERLSKSLSLESGKKVFCAHRADSNYPSVSAASIVAKVIRDREIRALSEKYGEIGSGYPSDPRTIKFLQTSIENRVDLSKIVRVKWKTYQNLISSSKNCRLNL